MIDIREYLKKKEKRQDEQRVEFQKQIRTHRIRTFLRTALIAGIIAGLIAAVYSQLKNQVYTGYTVVSSVEKTQYSGASVLDYREGFLTYSKDGVSYTDYRGNAVWNQTYGMQAPIISRRGNWVAVGDYNGHIIYDIGETGDAQEIDTNLPIKNLSVSANGVIAAVLEEGDVVWINIYNPTGEKAVSIRSTMQKSGYPVSLSLSDNGKLMQVAYLRAESGSMKAVVSFYNFGEVGQNYTDTMVSSYEYANSVVPFSAFMNSRTAFSVADNQLMIYDDEGAEIPRSIFQSFLENEIQDVYYSENYIGLIYLSETGSEKYRLEVYNISGKKELEKSFNLEYRDIQFYRDQIIIYNEAECIVCNMQGKEKYSGDIQEHTLLLKPLGGSRFLDVRQDSLDVIELR